ncbi:hypothetical protein EDC96DRAFT_578906 [Choanephora cucurbitarum]|nr:hypothetical protein EDC96DRAFT_578906 [Choanephora cucurbitarum]
MNSSVLLHWITNTGKDQLFQLKKTKQELTIEQVIYASNGSQEMLLMELSDETFSIPAIFIPEHVKTSFSIPSLTDGNDISLLKEVISVKEYMVVACRSNQKITPYLIIIDFEPMADCLPAEQSVKYIYHHPRTKDWMEQMTRTMPDMNSLVSSFFYSLILQNKLPQFNQVEPVIEFTLDAICTEPSRTQVPLHASDSQVPRPLPRPLPRSTSYSSSLPDTGSQPSILPPKPNSPPQVISLPNTSTQPKDLYHEIQSSQSMVDIATTEEEINSFLETAFSDLELPLMEEEEEGHVPKRQRIETPSPSSQDSDLMLDLPDFVFFYTSQLEQENEAAAAVVVTQTVPATTTTTAPPPPPPAAAEKNPDLPITTQQEHPLNSENLSAQDRFLKTQERAVLDLLESNESTAKIKMAALCQFRTLSLLS